jgi:uncharacterized metal-binding protein YceD (DUF177 family)
MQRHPYYLPLHGDDEGTVNAQYNIDKAFFDTIEETPIKDGKINISATLDKRSDIMVLEIEVKGTVKSNCDRCAASINLPVDSSFEYAVKRGELKADDNMIIYISSHDIELDIKNVIYESICLAKPLINAYDCESEDPRPCDMEALEKLEWDDEEEGGTSDVWEQLREITKRGS